MGAISEGEALLQAILADPEDDAPRLVYADWLEERGDPRGEFIRLQVQFADPALKGPRRWRLRAQAHRLLTKHEQAWLGPLHGLARRWEFRRGFADFVEMEADKFLDHADAIFRHTPLRDLELFGHTSWAARLAASPYLQQLASLRPPDVNLGELQTFLRSADLKPPRELYFKRGHFGVMGAQEIGGCPRLQGLAGLDLVDQLIEDEGLRAILGSPYLSGLTVLRLHWNRLTAAGAAALAATPRPQPWRELVLSSNELHDEGVCALAASPHLAGLRILDLAGTRCRDRGALAVAESPYLGELEVLRIHNYLLIGEAGREALLKRFGKRVCQV
jgi:uncharacterized protein (TIGR02996 family)